MTEEVGVPMTLSIAADGTVSLVIEQATLTTRAQAEALAKRVQSMATALSAKKAQAKSSRRTGSQAARKGRVKINGDTAAEAATDI